jgi:hypothetical protein
VLGLIAKSPVQSTAEGWYQQARLLFQFELALCGVMGPVFKSVTKPLCTELETKGGKFTKNADDFLFGRVHVAISS